VNQVKTQKEFSGIRGVIWPVHSHEIKKFLPMAIMMVFILFIFTILRDIKDALFINAPGSGAECISFVKIYGVTPSAFIFTVILFKLADILNPNKLFTLIVSLFLLYFGCFAFIIYPNRELFHLSLATIESLQQLYPKLHWVIPIIGNWSISLFYIVSDLWGSVVLCFLFWQFANRITKMQQARRFYSLFGMVGNIGLLISGSMVIFSSKYSKSHSLIANSFELNLKILMSAVLISGILILFCYYLMNKYFLKDSSHFENDNNLLPSSKTETLSIFASIKQLLKNRYVLLIALLVICYNMAINLVEGIWKGQIKIAFPNMNDYSAFMGKFSAMTGVITIIIMLLGVNILRRVSWRSAALIAPLMMLVTSIVFFIVVSQNLTNDPFTPIMGTTMVMLAVIIGMLQNSFSKGTKYSLFDATKNIAYMPLDKEVKVKGQAAVEVLGGRVGKSGGSLIQAGLLTIVSGNVSLLSFTYILGPLVVTICFIWLASVFMLNKKFMHLVNKKGQDKGYQSTNVYAENY